VYSRWDGSQDEFRLDAERALDALSNLMMEGLDAREALEWMRQHGFELAGLDMRVMGVSELLQELRDEIRELQPPYHLDRATDDLRRRLESALDREQGALRERHGFEPARMNDFQQRRHADTESLSDAIEQFRDWEFEDEEAGDEVRELLEELDRLREL